MALNKELFAALAPEFEDTSKPILDAIFPVAERQVNLSVWGEKLDEALVYLVAHMLTMAKRNGRVGDLSSQSTGSLSRSYGGLSAVKGSLDLTSYGVEFQRIRKQLVITPIVIC